MWDPERSKLTLRRLPVGAPYALAREEASTDGDQNAQKSDNKTQLR
ncbi:unnamed protein product [Penicillium salamii]|uniref:Uncharacterized protein n=1 Tax=Penicillium salamii TaxID=1612424 RepID=A0A9W4NP34_9EURO|nr:unnamed protein product [Penicillium salamii]CAG8052050.1 unnamed protein product [Penicillium salamii]CAG8165953.1 unnamed protein product [Penicillium salamii]CAG8176059.1 unnamed protein product [Penicillium salamii]CAG8205979.1 unnamed protein product [Penicillium salamii]